MKDLSVMDDGDGEDQAPREEEIQDPAAAEYRYLQEQEQLAQGDQQALGAALEGQTEETMPEEADVAMEEAGEDQDVHRAPTLQQEESKDAAALTDRKSEDAGTALQDEEPEGMLQTAELANSDGEDHGPSAAMSLIGEVKPQLPSDMDVVSMRHACHDRVCPGSMCHGVTHSLLGLMEDALNAVLCRTSQVERLRHPWT